MKLQDLQAGDLLFIRDNQAMSQAIQQATGQYSHVAIYFNQMIYHATRDKGVVRENLREFLLTHEQLVSVYRYPKINPDQVLVVPRLYLENLIMIVFIQIMALIIVRNILQKFCQFLRPFPCNLAIIST